MTRRLRVLFVEPEGRGGHWHYGLAVARALIGRAMEVRLATLSPFESLHGIGEIPISVIGQRAQATKGKWQEPLGRAFEHVGKLRGLRRVMREFRPDIVHLHDGLGHLDALYFGIIKLLGARVIFTAHEYLTPSHWLDVMRYRTADLILVLSSNGIADLTKYGIAESRIAQIPHISPLQLEGLCALSREEAKAAIGLPAGARVLLFFGFIVSRKGLDLLIDAHARISHEHPDVYLIIAGQPLEDIGRYREQIVRSGYSDRVILDPRYVPFDRMRVYFSAADVVVLPYRRIYQSGVLQWAYAFGRPVVVTDVGGIREAVGADGTGLIVDAGDAAGLARAILRLLTDEELARNMGDRGLQMARTKYSDEAVSEQLERLYRHLVRNGQS